MTRAKVHARVSTEEQLEGYSIDMQLEAGRALCKARGWAIVAEVVEEGESGKNFKRTKWQSDIRASAERREYDVLVCHKIDRFSRGTILKSLEELSWLRKHGVSFVSASEPLDFTSPYGELMLILLLWFARQYLINLSSEVTKGKKGKVNSGKSNANHPPFGYLRNANGDDVPNLNTQEAARLMFERADLGTSDLAISQWMNAQGHHMVSGKRFTKTAVRELLRNKFYCGYVRYRGLADGDPGERKRNSRNDDQWRRGAHEPIIEEALFDSVNAQRRPRSWNGGRPVTPFRAYLLKGLAHCSECGTRLTAGTSTLTQKPRYQCLAADKGIECPSNHAMVYEEALLPQIEALVAGLRIPREVLERAAELSRQSEPEAAPGRSGKEIEAEMERVDFVFEKGRMRQIDYEKKLAVLQAELDALAVPQVVVAPVTEVRISELMDTWRTGDKAMRHEMLCDILSRVDVDMKTKKITDWKAKPAYGPLIHAALGRS